MLRNLINKYLKENIPNDDVALLFSGGSDSLSILLSCLDLNIKPHLYTFRLSNHESQDSIYSKKISEIFSLKHTEVILNVDDINLLSDVEYIISHFKVKKKTHVQCIHPFIYLIPKINQSVILTGLCADDLYGTPRSMAKYAKTSFFNELRQRIYENIESSGYKFINQIASENNKLLIAPYKQSQDIYNYMILKTYKEMHSPKQKFIMFDDYKTELLTHNIYRRNSNLQCDSKIREWHDTLLVSNKSVTAIYNKIYRDKYENC